MTSQLEIQKNARKHLTKVKEKFSNHLSNKKVRFLLTLAWQTSERKQKAQKILQWIDKVLGDELIDSGKDQLKDYKELYNKWNEKKPVYDGSLDFGGNLLALKEFLDQWENPPKPALTKEQEQKLKDYDEFFKKRPKIKDLKKLDTSYSNLEKENERLRNHELNDNEQKIVAVFHQELPGSGGIGLRLGRVRRILANLKSNDLKSQVNPSLSFKGISLPERLATSFEYIVWIGEIYFSRVNVLNKRIKELNERINELENQNDE
jgi:hypothetical protein